MGKDGAVHPMTGMVATSAAPVAATLAPFAAAAATLVEVAAGRAISAVRSSLAVAAVLASL